MKKSEPKLPGAASYSQLWTASTCLRKYFLKYIIGLKEPAGEPLLFGTGVHAALAQYNRARRGGLLLHHDDLMEAHMAASAGTQEDRAARLFQAHRVFVDANPYEPEHVEAHCSLILKDGDHEARVRGYIDRVDDDHTIIDYKTASRTPSKTAANDSIQLALYARARSTDRAALVHMWETKRGGAQVVKQETRIDEQRVKNATSFVGGVERSLRNALHTNHWPKRAPDHTCNYCPFRFICWKGAKHPLLEVYKQLNGDPDEQK